MRGTAAATQVNFSLNRRELETTRNEWPSILGSEKEAASWQWNSLDEAATRTVAVINFSSDTACPPKGVCITHHNLVANTAQAIFNVHQGSSERWLAFISVYHAYSQLFAIKIAYKLQIPVYIMSYFTFDNFLRHILETFPFD